MPRFYYSEDFELADHPVVLRTPPLRRGELGTYHLQHNPLGTKWTARRQKTHTVRLPITQK